MTGKIDKYLCGEEMDGRIVMPKHYEYFFDEAKIMKVLFILTILLIVGGIAWL